MSSRAIGTQTRHSEKDLLSKNTVLDTEAGPLPTASARSARPPSATRAGRLGKEQPRASLAAGAPNSAPFGRSTPARGTYLLGRWAKGSLDLGSAAKAWSHSSSSSSGSGCCGFFSSFFSCFFSSFGSFSFLGASFLGWFSANFLAARRAAAGQGLPRGTEAAWVQPQHLWGQPSKSLPAQTNSTGLGELTATVAEAALPAVPLQLTGTGTQRPVPFPHSP